MKTRLRHFSIPETYQDGDKILVVYLEDKLYARAFEAEDEFKKWVNKMDPEVPKAKFNNINYSVFTYLKQNGIEVDSYLADYLESIQVPEEYRNGEFCIGVFLRQGGYLVAAECGDIDRLQRLSEGALSKQVFHNVKPGLLDHLNQEYHVVI